MTWKLFFVAGLVILWVIWPAIRIPRQNFFRRKLGAFGTYLLAIVGILALLQVLEFFLRQGR